MPLSSCSGESSRNLIDCGSIQITLTLQTINLPLMLILSSPSSNIFLVTFDYLSPMFFVSNSLRQQSSFLTVFSRPPSILYWFHCTYIDVFLLNLFFHCPSSVTPSLPRFWPGFSWRRNVQSGTVSSLFLPSLESSSSPDHHSSLASMSVALRATTLITSRGLLLPLQVRGLIWRWYMLYFLDHNVSVKLLQEAYKSCSSLPPLATPHVGSLQYQISHSARSLILATCICSLYFPVSWNC